MTNQTMSPPLQLQLNSRNNLSAFWMSSAATIWVHVRCRLARTARDKPK